MNKNTDAELLLVMSQALRQKASTTMEEGRATGYTRDADNLYRISKYLGSASATIADIMTKLETALIAIPLNAEITQLRKENTLLRLRIQRVSEAINSN